MTRMRLRRFKTVEEAEQYAFDGDYIMLDNAFKQDADRWVVMTPAQRRVRMHEKYWFDTLDRFTTWRRVDKSTIEDDDDWLNEPHAT